MKLSAAWLIERAGFAKGMTRGRVGISTKHALALVNRDGDGVVVSSIWSREETRTYGKAVQGFRTTQDPSDEELAAIAKARAAAT